MQRTAITSGLICTLALSIIITMAAQRPARAARVTHLIPGQCKIIHPPYHSADYWTHELGEDFGDNPASACTGSANSESGSLGTFTKAIIGSAAGEASQRIKFNLDSNQPRQVKVTGYITYVGGAKTNGLGAWSGTKKWWKIDGNRHEKAVDPAFGFDDIAWKAVDMALFAIPGVAEIRGAATAKEVAEAIGLIKDCYVLAQGLDELRNAGDAKRIKISFSKTFSPGQHVLEFGIRAGASGALTGMGVATMSGGLTHVSIAADGGNVRPQAPQPDQNDATTIQPGDDVQLTAPYLSADTWTCRRGVPNKRITDGADAATTAKSNSGAFGTFAHGDDWGVGADSEAIQFVQFNLDSDQPREVTVTGRILYAGSTRGGGGDAIAKARKIRYIGNERHSDTLYIPIGWTSFHPKMVGQTLAGSTGREKLARIDTPRSLAIGMDDPWDGSEVVEGLDALCNLDRAEDHNIHFTREFDPGVHVLGFGVRSSAQAGDNPATACVCGVLKHVELSVEQPEGEEDGEDEEGDQEDGEQDGDEDDEDDEDGGGSGGGGGGGAEHQLIR